MAKLLKNPTFSTGGRIDADTINAANSINVVGNVSALYLLGNGYYLNGVAGSSNYSNVNAAAYLLTNTGNIQAGYVGIGIASPTSALHISGANSTLARATLEATAASGASQPSLYFSKTNTTTAAIDLQGVIGWTRKLTDSSGISSSIYSQGTNNSAAPSMNLIYDAYSSHAFKINASANILTINSLGVTTTGIITAGNVNVGNLIAGTYGVYSAHYYYANGAVFSGGGTTSGATALSGLSDVNISGPSNGQVLKYNGSQWTNGTDNTTTGGTGTLASRSTSGVTISGLGAGANANVAITGFKTYTLMAIQTSAAAWVTVYSSTANRTNDITRNITTDPTPDSGVLAEVITNGNQKVWFSPALIGYSAESSPTNDIPIKVNNTGVTGDITVTLTLLQLEN